MDFFIPLFPFKTLIYFGILVPCAISDLKTTQVPRAPLLFLIITMIVSTPFEALPGSIFGATAGMIAFWLIRKMSGNGLGLADVWMAGATGAFGGAAFCAETTFLAIVLIVPRAFFLLRLKSHQSIPFLPSLTAGAFFLLLVEYFSGK